MWRAPSVWRGWFVIKVAVWATMLAGGMLGAAVHEGWRLLIFQLLAALGMVHGVELCHQALHHLGIRNKRINYLVGVALGAPMLVSFSAYQDAHLTHHKTVGTPQDAEFFDYGGKDRHTLYDLVVLLFMPLHYTRFVSRVSKALLGWDVRASSAKRGKRMRIEYIGLGLAVAVAVGLSLHWHSNLILKAWIQPLVLLAGPIHALIELPEHYNCSRCSRDPRENTRSIESMWLMRWFTNGNNFHVEHHLEPAWPIEALGQLHRRIRPDIRQFDQTYLQFYRRFFRDYFARPDALATLDPENIRG